MIGIPGIMFIHRFFLFLFLVVAPVVSAAPMVQNASFEANPGTAWPGYGGIILNWVGSPFTGIDPLLVGVPLGDDASIYGIHSFANNGIVPDGTNVAFIASPFAFGFIGNGLGEAKSQISQEISGFEAGKTYVVTYHANNRAGGESPFLPANLTVLLEGTVIHGPFLVNPLEPLRSRTRRYVRFATREFTTTTSDPRDLVFRNENILNDASILLDQVAIIELGPLKLLSARRLVRDPRVVVATFSSNPDPTTAENPEHYQLGPDVQVQTAKLTTDPRVVQLTMSSPINQEDRDLSVQFILDPQGKGMLLANSQVPLSLEPLYPEGFGTNAPAFIDDFDLTPRRTHWVATGPAGDVYFPLYRQGWLRVGGGAAGANHLIYDLPGYDSSVQEIVAKVRVREWSSQSRAGLVASADPATGQGINFVFKPGGMQLDLDGLGPGPQSSFEWATNRWYWIKLRHQPSVQPGVVDVEGKIWLADGDTPEPSSGLTWDYTPAQSARFGKAGITGSNRPETSVMDIDFILIKATGLPTITVTKPKPPPLFLSIETAGKNVRVSWPGGESSKGYSLEGADGLEEAPVWQFLKDSSSNSDEDQVFEEEISSGKRFYRLQAP